MTEPIGWYVVQAVPSGGIESLSKKSSVQMNGVQEQLGSLGILSKTSEAGLSGRVDAAGSIESVSAKSIVSLAESSITGEMAMSSAKTVTAFVEEFRGSIGVSLKKAIATLAAEQVQVGSISAASKKSVATIIGGPVILVANTDSGGITARSLSTRNLAAALPLRENDLLIQLANLIQGGHPVVTDPANWTNMLGPNALATSPGNAAVAFYHLVTAAEVAANTTSWTMTNVFSINQIGRQVTLVIRGIDPTLPIDVAAWTFTGSPTQPYMAFPELTPTRDGSLLVYFGGPDDAGRGITAPTDPMVEVLRVSNAAPTENLLVMKNKNLSSAGVPVPSFTSPITGGNDESVGIGFAVTTRPQP